MIYKLELSAREKLVSILKHDPNYLNVSAHRKAFQVMTNKLSVLFEDSLTDSQLLELILYRNVKHIVQNSFQSAKDKLEFLKKVCLHTDRFFDINFNLLGDTAKTNLVEFNHLTSRNDIIDEVCNFASLSASSSRATKPLQTIEELLMNAQVSAVGGRPKSIHIKSHLKVELSDDLIAFSTFDPYGSLDSKKFFKKIEAGQVLGLDQSMNYGKGGAGVGSSLIYQNCDSLFIGVQPLKKTRVSVIMPYNVTERKYEGIQKSVHIFTT